MLNMNTNSTMGLSARLSSVILICGLLVGGVGCGDDDEPTGHLPSVPSDLTASNVTSTSFTLSWNRSTDDVGIADYEIFRNNVSVGTTSDTSLVNTGLTKSTTYRMTVRARDTDGNLSAQSPALSVTTSGNPSVVNLSATRQIIRGFGGATVFQPGAPLTTDQLDKLFGNGPGQIGFTLL